ncbi:MAG: UDP-N-acetylmuramate--L-alanine ligase [Egibacteraceae bacterium]
MSALAQVALCRRAQVSGSDITGSPRLSALTASGCRIQFGHVAANVGEPTCVVFSTAIAEDNPELLAARERGIPVVHRAHALAALMEGHTSVAVAGTHGKSSTTAMLAVALRELGLDPSYAIGADLHIPGSGGHHGAGEIFVAEADESDHSFHVLRPDVALVLNVDDDHPENYGGLADHINAYAAFARRITIRGVLVVNVDDDGARQLSTRLTRDAPWLRLVTYGTAEHADVRIISMQTRRMAATTTVAMPDGVCVRIELGVPGRHMAHNAVAVLAVAGVLGIDTAAAASALGRYGGVRRRLTPHGEPDGVSVVDSFAHHPTEIAADLDAARSLAEADGRVLVVFQPAGYGRTWALGAEMGAALAAADAVVLLEIYNRHGDVLPGVTSGIVADALAAHGGAVIAASDRQAAVDAAVEMAEPGDVVLTMGSGDVTRLGRVICKRITASARHVPALR